MASPVVKSACLLRERRVCVGDGYFVTVYGGRVYIREGRVCFGSGCFPLLVLTVVLHLQVAEGAVRVVGGNLGVELDGVVVLVDGLVEPGRLVAFEKGVLLRSSRGVGG